MSVVIVMFMSSSCRVQSGMKSFVGTIGNFKPKFQTHYGTTFRKENRTISNKVTSKSVENFKEICYSGVTEVRTRLVQTIELKTTPSVGCLEQLNRIKGTFKYLHLIYF